MVLRSMALAAAKRVPLIRFRKGGYAYANAGGSGGATASKQASAQIPAAAKKTASGGAIEDWELPPRYWRKPIANDEMEYINRGGPA